jgi:hypothetical protein
MSPVSVFLLSCALVHEDQAHPSQSSTFPTLSSSSPHARVLSSSHDVSPSQGASRQATSINASVREVRIKG